MYHVYSLISWSNVSSIHESDSAENFTVVASGAVTAAITGGHPGADLSVPRYIQYTTIVSSAVLFW